MNPPFGAALRERRRTAGLSQRALAARTGLDFSYISKLENGRLPPPAADTVVALCRVLGVAAEELLALVGKLPSDVQRAVTSRQGHVPHREAEAADGAAQHAQAPPRLFAGHRNALELVEQGPQPAACTPSYPLVPRIPVLVCRAGPAYLAIRNCYFEIVRWGMQHGAWADSAAGRCPSPPAGAGIQGRGHHRPPAVRQDHAGPHGLPRPALCEPGGARPAAVRQEVPRRFLAHYGPGSILDEAHRCPELFSYLQGVVDAQHEPGQYILTGSQHFGLVAQVTQSLAGRVGFLRLLPFSLDELAAADLLPAGLDELLFRGGYPPLYQQPVRPERWYSAYVTT